MTPPTVTLLDLYFDHLASSPQSPVTASFLASSPATHSGSMGRGRALGASSLRLNSLASSNAPGGASRAAANAPSELSGAASTAPREVAHIPRESSQFHIPKKTNFLCCGIAFKTFELLARHYEQRHTAPSPAEHNGVNIPTAKQHTPSHSQDDDDMPIVSLTELLTFDPKPFDQNAFDPKQFDPAAFAFNQLPQSQLFASNTPFNPAPPAPHGKSQLSLGLKKQTPPPQTPPAPPHQPLQNPFAAYQTHPPSNYSPASEPSPSESSADPTTPAYFKSAKSQDTMFAANNVLSTGQDDLDATLSAFLSNQQPPPIVNIAQQSKLLPQGGGRAIANQAAKRNLSSAAFSLGSYTAADLKKLRQDFNFSGIDLDWLMAGVNDGPDSAAVAAAAGGVPAATTANLFGNRDINNAQGGVREFVNAKLEGGSDDTMFGTRTTTPPLPPSTTAITSDNFQSMAIPSHISTLAKPIQLSSLTPETYLRMLLEAHHLVGQATSFLGARDYQAVAHELIQSGVNPQELTNVQLAQIVQGVQGMEISGADVAGGGGGMGVAAGAGAGGMGGMGGINYGVPRQQQQQQSQPRPLQQQQQHQHQQPVFNNNGLFTSQPAAPRQTQILNGGAGGLAFQPAVPPPTLETKPAPPPVPAAPAPTASKIYTCPECGKKYKSHSGFKYHLDHQHPDYVPVGKQSSHSSMVPVAGAGGASEGLVFAKQTPMGAPSSVAGGLTSPPGMMSVYPNLGGFGSAFPGGMVPSGGMGLVDSAAAVAAGGLLFGSDGMPVRQIHPSQLNKPFKCGVAGCLKSYKNKGGLKYHVEHDHA
ncbi:hypothetical protein HDU98_009560 [Podochytrium sp. JEL0797]|nr:hypothetical protein HDU98_009560 [Podochytrium sp. JEL0797]